MAERKGLTPHRVIEVSDVAVRWVELVVSVMLALLAVAGVVFLGVEFVHVAQEPGLKAFESLFSAILLVFILLELYRIGVSFLKGEDVINKVFEVGLVALVRQVIVSEFVHLGTTQMLIIAGLIVALGLSWYLSRLAMGTRYVAKPLQEEPAE
jgi:uncharacterized membrane protein (DUF373 family)